MGILFLLALAFLFYFLHGIGAVAIPYWDEGIYINAARGYLTSSKPFPNPEHPPLGKLLIALGIKIFGDNPLGWRFFSALSGALSCLLIIYLVYRLTRRQGVAWFVGGLLFLDPLLFVHFRMAMLDPPLLLFLLAAVCLAIDFYLDPKAKLWRIWLLGATLGLALATKLLTLVLMPLPCMLVAYRLYRDRVSWRRWVEVLLLLLFLPPLLYLLCFRVLGYNPREVWELLTFNFDYHRTYHGGTPVSSRWYEWLYIGQPLWYFWKKTSPGYYQAILASGNLVLWIAAQLLAAYAVFRRRRDPTVWLLAGIIFVQFLLYASKPNTFLYYMVEILPFAYVLMGIAIADLFDRFGARHRRILQFDFACLWVGAFLIYWNYSPYLWGQTISEAQFKSVNAQLAVSTQAPFQLPPITK